MGVSVNVGDVIRGKYAVERVLGAGGMGVVLAAWDPALERRVAIKILQPEMLANPEVVQRFLREARAAAKIQSDHVAHVVEVSVLDDGSPFMVMEHLEGYDLSRVAPSAASLPFGVAVSWVVEACRALEEAHALGIVHRDLKPANLFLAKRRDGTARIKVLDFGISKVIEPEGSSRQGLTRTSVVMGSSEYMSPEQMLSTRDVDARSDIWSLGVILYELCTGQVPYPGETPTQVYANLVSKPITSLRSLRPDVPPQLEAVMMSCLAVDRDKRIPTVSELRGRLLPFASGPESFMALQTAGGAAGSAPPWTPTPSAISARDSSTTAVMARGSLSAPFARPLWPFGLAGAGVVLAAVAVLAASSGRGASPQAATAVDATPVAAAPSSSGPVVDVASAAPTFDAPRAVDATSAPTSSAPPSHDGAVAAAEVPHRAATSTAKAPPAARGGPAKPVSGGCDPPFTTDARGHRTIKPECNR